MEHTRLTPCGPARIPCRHRLALMPMNMPTPHPGAPRPGQHLPGHNSAPDPQNFADPDRIAQDVSELLDQLDQPSGSDGIDREQIPAQARVLEQAHDVLVRALATVDKI